MQTDATFKCVNPIIEDTTRHRFVYRGILGSADNITGVIESNVPLSEIVSSAEGNIKLQEMMSEENTTRVRNEYYTKIGEPIEPLKGHNTFFGKPEIPLGTIIKIKYNDYRLYKNVSIDIEDMIKEEREKIAKLKEMREENSVEIDIGEIVVARQDCWLEQKNGIEFAGINKDALYYKYSPKYPIQTENNKFVYKGNLVIGRINAKEKAQKKRIKMIQPFEYEDIVLWTDGKNLIQYFLEDKLNGLNFALADIFARENIKEDGFLGGITKNEEGQCKITDNIPESVKKVLEQMTLEQNSIKETDKTNDNIIKFEDPRR